MSEATSLSHRGSADTRTPTEAAERFAARSMAGYAVTGAAGAAFGLLVGLVRGHWAPLEAADHGTAATVNAAVAGHPAVITALNAVTALGGRTVLIWVTALAVLVLSIRRRFRLAGY